jgi:hypothetical protein
MKAFIVVNRKTRKILARFESREEAEAFRAGLMTAEPKDGRNLGVRGLLEGHREPARRGAGKSPGRRRAAG